MKRVLIVGAVGLTLSMQYHHGSLRVDEHKIDDPYTPKRRSKGEKKRNKSARYTK